MSETVRDYSAPNPDLNLIFQNARSEHFMETLGLFKKGLIAFENQQSQLRRHLARLAYSKSEEGAAYFKQKAKEELSVIVKERIEEYKKREAELEREKEKKEKEALAAAGDTPSDAAAEQKSAAS